MDPLLLLSGLVGAAFAALASVVVQARRFSGKIQTSEARELWEESRSIRDALHNRVGELTAEVERLEKRIERIDTHNAELNVKVAEQQLTITELRIKLRRAEGDFETSEEVVADLTGQLDACTRRVHELERRARGE